jgi:hypothetical protein
MKRILGYGTVALVLFLLTGCSEDITGGGETVHSEAEGLWRDGTDTVAMITASGSTTIVPPYAAIYSGRIDANETAVTGGYLTAVTSHGTGGIYLIKDGNISTQEKLAFRGEDPSYGTVSFDLAYDDRYERPSSTGLLEGFWESDSGNTYMSVGGGIISGYDIATGCTLGGTFRIIDSSKNLYRLDLTLSLCSSYTYSTDYDFSGYATLTDTISSNDTLLFSTTGYIGPLTRTHFSRTLHR